VVNKNVLSCKFVAILTVLYALGEIQYPTFIHILVATIWIVLSFFIWKRTIWAPVLLGVLSIFRLIDDILLEIPHFYERVHEHSSLYPQPVYSISSTMIIVMAMALEFILLGCFIYHGIHTYSVFRHRTGG
jgi:hypothetical protein